MKDDIKIEYRSVEALIPYARNARTHTDEQVTKVAASIREFGWTNPILVDGKNGIVAGHCRLLAAKKLGLTRVPVIELAYLTEAQKRAYILADNQLAINGSGWDEELLRIELSELKEEDFDLSLTGFDDAEIDRMLDRGFEPIEIANGPNAGVQIQPLPHRDVKTPDASSHRGAQRPLHGKRCLP